MAYVIVEFEDKDGGGVSEVHSTWLTPLEREVFWPTYKEQLLFDKSVLNLLIARNGNYMAWSVYFIPLVSLSSTRFFTNGVGYSAAAKTIRR